MYMLYIAEHEVIDIFVTSKTIIFTLLLYRQSLTITIKHKKGVCVLQQIEKEVERTLAIAGKDLIVL